MVRAHTARRAWPHPSIAVPAPTRHPLGNRNAPSATRATTRIKRGRRHAEAATKDPTARLERASRFLAQVNHNLVHPANGTALASGNSLFFHHSSIIQVARTTTLRAPPARMRAPRSSPASGRQRAAQSRCRARPPDSGEPTLPCLQAFSFSETIFTLNAYRLTGAPALPTMTSTRSRGVCPSKSRRAGGASCRTSRSIPARSNSASQSRQKISASSAM